jgi:hypothetical protein
MNIFAQATYIIRSIPFNNYSYEHDVEDSQDIITILGWSRDGKILYEYRDDWNGIDYFIVDMIEDRVVWDGGDELWKNKIQLWRYINDAKFLKNFVIERAEQYNIEPVISPVGQFPYRNNGREYIASFTTDVTSPSTGYDVDIFLEQNFSPFKMKKVNTKRMQPTVRFDPFEFWYAKSPFENRLAVIFIIPFIGGEFGEIDYRFFVYGAHLDVGFMLDRRK